MTTTLADLVTAQTSADLLAQALANLQSNGLPTTAWQPATVPRTLVSIDATALADQSATIAAIAAGGFLDTATGAWLTLLASEFYALDRKLAVPAQRTCRLTAVAGAGPYTIAIGGMWALATNGKRFQNTTGGTLNVGSTLDLTFQAEAPGSSYNVGDGTITSLVTPLAGVTIVDTADLVVGTDDETDAALRARCRDQWGTVAAPAAPGGAYAAWALAASSDVTKVLVPSPPGDGTLSVLIAGAGGSLDAAHVTTVQSYINDRKPTTDTPTVASAANKACTVTGTVYVTATDEATAQTGASTAATALVAALPIGGDALGGGSKGLALARVEKLFVDQAGVLNVTGLKINGAAADVVFASTDVGTIDITGMTWSTV